MLFIIVFMLVIAALAGLDWAALKFGSNSRTPELLNEKICSLSVE
jgi:hypothetical protein